MRRFKLNVIGNSFDIEIEKGEERKLFINVNGKRYEAVLQDDFGKELLLAVDGGLYTVELEGEPIKGKINAKVNNRERIVESRDLLGSREITRENSIPMVSEGERFVEEGERPKGISPIQNAILAPLPGKVVAVKVGEGDEVKTGDVVVILEAMKMENEIVSNMDGKISEVRVGEGDTVDANDVLAVVE